MLEISNLHTHYGSSHIMQGIDLTAGPGEVIGIFGRNGVGKTTLLKTIAGWVKPARGEIHVDGQRIDGLPPTACAAAASDLCRRTAASFPVSASRKT